VVKEKRVSRGALFQKCRVHGVASCLVWGLAFMLKNSNVSEVHMTCVETLYFVNIVAPGEELSF
jgi:hypothetical protein